MVDASIIIMVNKQVIIPMTLILSYLFLGQIFTISQTLGATIIFVGASIAVIPSFRGGDATGSTTVGIALFFSSLIPGAFSNVVSVSQREQGPSCMLLVVVLIGGGR